MKTLSKLAITILLPTIFVLLTTIFVGIAAKAGDQHQEVPLYKIADIPDDGIYKMVHHGCALYIIREEHGGFKEANVATVAIATGEGCK